MSEYKNKLEHFKRACGIEKARIKHLLKIEDYADKHIFLTCLANEIVIEMFSAIYHDEHHGSSHHGSTNSHKHTKDNPKDYKKGTTEYYKNCWQSLTALDPNISLEDLNITTSNCTNMTPYTKMLGNIFSAQTEHE